MVPGVLGKKGSAGRVRFMKITGGYSTKVAEISPKVEQAFSYNMAAHGTPGYPGRSWTTASWPSPARAGFLGQ